MLVVSEAMSTRGAAVVNDDVLFRFRLRLFSLAAELGSVQAACRAMGVHPSTYYRWRGPVLRSGLEMLRPRERRPPRMPNQARPHRAAGRRVRIGPPRARAAPDQRHARPGALGRDPRQPQTASGGSCAATASAGGSAACRWSRATPVHAEPRAQARRARARPRGVPELLQRGTCPHRAADQQPDTARGLDRGTEDEATMTEMRRYISGAVQPRRSASDTRSRMAADGNAGAGAGVRASM
jgi:hypothetical protein